MVRNIRKRRWRVNSRGKIRWERLFATGPLCSNENTIKDIFSIFQMRVYVCVCVCMRVPITFAGIVTQFIFMSILTMYFLFAHRFYAQFNSPRVHKLTIYQFRISTKTNIRYEARGQPLRIVSKHVCWSTINIHTVLIYSILCVSVFIIDKFLYNLLNGFLVGMGTKFIEFIIGFKLWISLWKYYNYIGMND